MSDISRQIWDMKYRLKAPDGTPIDRDVADSWTRVALALAEAEPAGQWVAHAKDFAGAGGGKDAQFQRQRGESLAPANVCYKPCHLIVRHCGVMPACQLRRS